MVIDEFIKGVVYGWFFNYFMGNKLKKTGDDFRKVDYDIRH